MSSAFHDVWDEVSPTADAAQNEASAPSALPAVAAMRAVHEADNEPAPHSSPHNPLLIVAVVVFACVIFNRMDRLHSRIRTLEAMVMAERY